MRRAGPDPATLDRLRDLHARRNQLEVMLAALERQHPGVAAAPQPTDPVALRARRQWERMRADLAAVELALAQVSG